MLPLSLLGNTCTWQFSSQSRWDFIPVLLCNISQARQWPFYVLDQSFAETKDWDQTAQLWSQLEFRLTNHRSASSSAHRWCRRISSFIFELAKKLSEWNSRRCRQKFTQNCCQNRCMFVRVAVFYESALGAKGLENDRERSWRWRERSCKSAF